MLSDCRAAPSSAKTTARWCCTSSLRPTASPTLTAWLATQGALLTELRAGSRSLEQAFLTLVSQSPDPTDAAALKKPSQPSLNRPRSL